MYRKSRQKLRLRKKSSSDQINPLTNKDYPHVHYLQIGLLFKGGKLPFNFIFSVLIGLESVRGINTRSKEKCRRISYLIKIIESVQMSRTLDRYLKFRHLKILATTLSVKTY